MQVAALGDVKGEFYERTQVAAEVFAHAPVGAGRLFLDFQRVGKLLPPKDSIDIGNLAEEAGLERHAQVLLRKLLGDGAIRDGRCVGVVSKEVVCPWAGSEVANRVRKG